MEKKLPDKWIRRAIYGVVNGIEVDGETINCYDLRTGVDNPKNFVIIQTQSSDVVKDSKCDYRWRSSVLLEINTRYSNVGNTGSRLLADNILEAVKDATNDLALDALSEMTILNQTLTFPSDLSIQDGTETLFRKFLRLELFIN